MSNPLFLSRKVTQNEVVRKLPQPQKAGGAAWRQQYFIFPCKLDGLDLEQLVAEYESWHNCSLKSHVHLSQVTELLLPTFLFQPTFCQTGLGISFVSYNYTCISHANPLCFKQPYNIKLYKSIAHFSITEILFYRFKLCGLYLNSCIMFMELIILIEQLERSLAANTSENQFKM